MSRRSLHAGKVCTEMAGLTKFSLHGISEDLQTLISIRRRQFCVWKSTKYLTRNRAIRRPLGSASKYSSVSSRYHWTAPQMERRKQWNFQKQELRQEAKLSPIFSTVRQTLSSRREWDLPPQKHSEKEISFPKVGLLVWLLTWICQGQNLRTATELRLSSMTFFLKGRRLQ